jgi:hypothetical protein
MNEDASFRELEAASRAIADSGIAECDCRLPMQDRVANIVTELRAWRLGYADLAAKLDILRNEMAGKVAVCCADKAGQMFCDAYGCGTLKRLIQLVDDESRIRVTSNHIRELIILSLTVAGRLPREDHVRKSFLSWLVKNNLMPSPLRHTWECATTAQAETLDAAKTHMMDPTPSPAEQAEIKAQYDAQRAPLPKVQMYWPDGRPADGGNYELEDD